MPRLLFLQERESVKRDLQRWLRKTKAPKALTQPLGEVVETKRRPVWQHLATLNGLDVLGCWVWNLLNGLSGLKFSSKNEGREHVRKRPEKELSKIGTENERHKNILTE